MERTRGDNQVEFLRGAIREGAEIVKAHFVMKRGLLAEGEPMYQLTLKVPAQPSAFQEFAWTPELEEYLLLERPTKMSDEQEEVDRLANVLANNLRSAEMAFGKDYAQAVFVQVLRQQPEYNLSEYLDRIARSEPSTSSEQYMQCKAFLESAIVGLQNTIVLMGYKEHPRAMIGEALELVLDTRYHFSLRDRLFPKAH